MIRFLLCFEQTNLSYEKPKNRIIPDDIYIYSRDRRAGNSSELYCEVNMDMTA